MTGHGLGGTDRDFLAKQISDGVRFEGVTERRRGAVGVDVADYAGIEVGVAQGVAHYAETAFVLGGGLRHVIGVRGHTVANQFRQDGRAAAAGMLEFFEDEDAGAFAHDEAVAILVPGTAGAGGVVIARGKCAHGGESAYAHGSDGGFGASGNHYVGVMVLDDAKGIADGVGAGGAGGGRRFIRTLGAEAHGNVPGGEVDDGGGNEKRGNLARSAGEEGVMFALDHVESADARADMHAYALGVFGCDLEVGHLHRFVGGGEREVDEAAHLFYFFFLDEIEGIEVADLGCDLAGNRGGVEPGNAVDAVLAREQSLPHRGGGIAQRADQADAGNDDPSGQSYLPPFPCLPM